MWNCPKCESKIDPSFEFCWNCGTSKEGVPDPNFVRADKQGPIFDPTFDREPKLPDDSLEDLAGVPLSELSACYEAYNLLEATFLVDQLLEARIPAVCDTIDLNAVHVAFGRPKIYVRAENFERARTWLEAFEEHRRREHEHADDKS